MSTTQHACRSTLYYILLVVYHRHPYIVPVSIVSVPYHMGCRLCRTPRIRSLGVKQTFKVIYAWLRWKCHAEKKSKEDGC